MDYIPTRDEILWALGIVRSVRHSGRIIFPGARLIFRHDLFGRALILTNPEILRFANSKEIFERTKIIFAWIDYQVKE